MSVRPYSRYARVVGCVMGSSCEFWCKEKRAFESTVFISFNPFPPQLGLLTGEIPAVGAEPGDGGVSVPPSVNIVWGGSSAFFDRRKHQASSLCYPG